MKKNRLLCLLLIVIITCTGCSAQYNIYITKDTIEEEINVTDNISQNRTKNDILKQYNMWYPTFVNYIKQGETIEIEDFSKKADGIEYHEKSINTITNGYQYTYKYLYNINDYYDSYALARAFYETKVYKGYNSLSLKTSKENFLCEYNYFDTVKVNIKVDPDVYKLNYTNTKNIKNNTYTWILNRSNCNNSEIILTIDKISSNNSSTNTNNNGNNNDNNNVSIIKDSNEFYYYIILAVIVLLILLGYKYFIKFKEKNNNIDDN